MTSIRRRLTVPEVTALLDQTAINNLILSATVNDKVNSTTVNSKITVTRINELLASATIKETINSLVENKVVVGTVWVEGEHNSTVDIGKNIAGAAVSFNSNNDIDTSCSCTWSGTNLSVRNSSTNNYTVSYIVVTE